MIIVVAVVILVAKGWNCFTFSSGVVLGLPCKFLKYLIICFGLCGLVIPCSPRGPRFTGSNLVEVDGFFRM